MLVKLQTTKFLIYAELDKAERVTHLASKNRIRPQTCLRSSMRSSNVAISESHGALPMTGIPILFGFLEPAECLYFLPLS